MSDGYGELQAVHGTRHVDVCEHDPNIRALLKDANRAVGVSRFQGAKPAAQPGRPAGR